jgi:multidrug resistance protein, MATE family
VRVTVLVPTRNDLRALRRLAVPIVIVQVGVMVMGTVDTIMVGHVSADALASVALGNLVFFFAVGFGMGGLLALDPVIAQAVGAGDEPAVARGMQRGLLLAALVAVPTSLLLVPVVPILTMLRQPVEIIPTAARYTWATIPGIFPFFAFIVLRQSLQAMGRLAPIVTTIIVANLVHIGLNWMLIFGKLGAPAMGAVGAGIASSISRWFLAVMMLVTGWPVLRHHLRPLRTEARRLAPLLRMAAIGVPIGLQYSLEGGAFIIVALLMGTIGAVEVGAHQVAINLAALTFMVPLGVSSAAAVLVGQAVGRGDPVSARRSAGAALVLGTGIMAVSALLFLVMPELLARMYTIDASVVAVASLLIPIAGVFQVFDGLQVVSIGVLRGVGDTRAPMIIAAVGYWLIGVPVSAWLGFRAHMGAVGLWWGLVVGLAAVSLTLIVRVAMRLRRDLSRLTIDERDPVGSGA